MPDSPPPPTNLKEDFRPNWWDIFFQALLTTILDRNWFGALGDAMETVISNAASTWWALVFKAQVAFVTLSNRAYEDMIAHAPDTITRLAARGLSDFFGTDVPPQGLTPGAGLAGNVGLSERLGGLVLDAMFGPGAATTGPPINDPAANAQKLLGVGINMGVTGLIRDSFVPPILAHFLPHFADLKENIAHNLGMGRLTRRGLAPLLATRIVNPLTKKLNHIYRPTLLTVGEAVRAFNRGDLPEPEFRGLMADRGYEDDVTGMLLAQNTRYPTTGDLKQLLQNGDVRPEDVISVLKSDGYSEEVAQTLLVMMQNERVHGYLLEIATQARTMYAAREITQEEFQSLAEQAGLSEREKTALLAVAELERGRPKRLTPAEMDTLYQEGVVTSDELRTFLVAEGYSEQDVAWLQASAVKKKAITEGKQQQKAPLPLPGTGRPLTEQQVVEGYRRGLITPDALGLLLAELGFEGGALQALVATAESKRQAFADAQAKHRTPPRGAALPKTTAHEAYVRGLLSRQDLEAAYLALGYNAQAVQLLLGIADGDKTAYELRLQKAAGKAVAPKKPPAATPSPAGG